MFAQKETDVSVFLQVGIAVRLSSCHWGRSTRVLRQLLVPFLARKLVHASDLFIPILSILVHEKEGPT